jgi:hypothetical protein
MKGQFFQINTDGSHTVFKRELISSDEANGYVGSSAVLVNISGYAAFVNGSGISSGLPRNAVLPDFHGNVLVGGRIQADKLVGMSAAKARGVLAVIRARRER